MCKIVRCCSILYYLILSYLILSLYHIILHCIVFSIYVMSMCTMCYTAAWALWDECLSQLGKVKFLLSFFYLRWAPYTSRLTCGSFHTRPRDFTWWNSLASRLIGVVVGVIGGHTRSYCVNGAAKKQPQAITELSFYRLVKKNIQTVLGPLKRSSNQRLGSLRSVYSSLIESKTARVPPTPNNTHKYKSAYTLGTMFYTRGKGVCSASGEG